MTQIEVADGDIAEVLRLIPNLVWLTVEQVREEEWAGILAHARTIAKLRVAREALDSIEVYGSDTLSGRVKPDPSTYREWLIGGVREMHNRARQALAQITQETPE